MITKLEEISAQNIVLISILSVKVAFQCLHTLNCQQQHLNQLREDLLLHHHAVSSATGGGNVHHSSSGDSKEQQKESHSLSPSKINSFT